MNDNVNYEKCESHNDNYWGITEIFTTSMDPNLHKMRKEKERKMKWKKKKVSKAKVYQFHG